MDQTKEIIKDGKSSPENLALKILGKRCQDECRNLGIDLFYKENGQREIEYNLDSVYTYLSKLSFQNIGSYGVSIVAFQIYFEANNIDIGKIDGIEGPKFISGIKKYQIQNNLPQTGRLDTKTVATIKNDIKEKQKTMICSNEKPTTQNNSFTEEKNNSTTNPETINQTCEYKVTTIRNQYNQNFDNEIRKICDWCREDKGNYFLKFSLTLEDPE
ncbi:MAG: peptidoglycan-binding protein [Patescibacteria group bacterium]|nr:peptidoglycan-binding protein [Patescibacteria group bacterium]